MKRFLYVIAVTIMVVTVWNLYENVGAKTKKITRAEVASVSDDVFKNYGIYDSECDIDCYCYYGNMYMSEETIHEQLEKIARYIGINGEYDYERKEAENGYKTIISKTADKSGFAVTMSTVENISDKNAAQSQYITVNLKLMNSISSGIYYKTRIVNALKKFVDSDKNPDVNMCIKGNIYGNLDDKKKEEIALSVFENAGAKKIFEHTEDGIYSLYGYSGEMDKYISVGNKKININVLFSYDETNNVTQIMIGSPVVNYDY